MAFFKVALDLFVGEGRLHLNLVFEMSQGLSVIRVDNQQFWEGKGRLADVHELFGRLLIIEHEYVESFAVLLAHWLQHLLENRSKYLFIHMHHEDGLLVFGRVG